MKKYHQNFAKTVWMPTCSSKCSRNGERILSWPTRENHGNSWLSSTKLQVWTKEKTLWGYVLVVNAFRKIFFSRFQPYAHSKNNSINIGLAYVWFYKGMLLISNKNFKLFLLSELLLIFFINFIGFWMR